MNNEPKEIVNYRSDENKALFQSLVEQVELLTFFDDDFDNDAARRYTKIAFNLVVKYVNNDRVNVLEEYPDEIIEIAKFNKRKDNLDRNNSKLEISESDSSSNGKIKSITQGPLSITYDNELNSTSASISSSMEIPDYIKAGIRRYLRGF